MSVFKCKMCGGTLEFAPGDTVATCEYCGTKQTLPRLDDDKRASLYDRAGHFRRNNEFDKAAGIYEQILSEDNTDAEAYWSLVLCRYGIEYVEDPQTHKRIPTVNRAQYTSIFDDEDYKSAIANADAAQREVYETEAKAINEIQKGILAISQKEEPFDVFICYKETDENGRRTPDSVLANDLYHQLTGEGFKVFFARITLEDKLGSAYEPYIFAALNSSKVMVVLGTKPAYFNAVWVKNEWSRYLALIKSGAKKILIPAYKDMDPYDLPEEFSHLQAQDMSKLGFMQDLIRGIQKLTGTEQRSTVPSQAFAAVNATAAPLLKRVRMCLEDKEFDRADALCEQVLNLDPECAEAYMCKALAHFKATSLDDILDVTALSADKDFEKAMRFGDEKQIAELKICLAEGEERKERARKREIYDRAKKLMEGTQNVYNCTEAAALFSGISGYEDADALATVCREKVKELRCTDIYDRAKRSGEYRNFRAATDLLKTIPGYRDADALCAAYEKEAIYQEASGKQHFGHFTEAVALYEQIPGYKDADAQIELCRKYLADEEKARIARERQQARAKLFKPILCIAACVLAALALLYMYVIKPHIKRNYANELLNAGSYQLGYALLQELGDTAAIAESKYTRAVELAKQRDYVGAIALLHEVGYAGADAQAKLKEIVVQYCRAAEAGDTVYFGAYEQDNIPENGKEAIAWLVLEKEEDKILLISDKAIDCEPYNTSDADITWASCSLREWLNGAFLNAAFNSAEQALIANMNVSADKNPKYNTDPGNATTDKVFLLSIDEVNTYFGSDEARKCVPTAYAKANGAWSSDIYTKDGAAACKWWLRSPGQNQSSAAYVYEWGQVYDYGGRVRMGGVCVRPALWINLDA